MPTDIPTLARAIRNATADLAAASADIADQASFYATVYQRPTEAMRAAGHWYCATVTDDDIIGACYLNDATDAWFDDEHVWSAAAADEYIEHRYVDEPDVVHRIYRDGRPSTAHSSQRRRFSDHAQDARMERGSDAARGSRPES